MPDQIELLARAKIAKLAHQEMLMRKANVVGIGIGQTRRDSKTGDRICLVVMVSQKLPVERLSDEDLIPRELDGIPVEVRQIGEPHALD